MRGCASVCSWAQSLLQVPPFWRCWPRTTCCHPPLGPDRPSARALLPIALAVLPAQVVTACPRPLCLLLCFAEVGAAVRAVLPIAVAMLPINAAVYVFDGIITGAADFKFMAGAQGHTRPACLRWLAPCT